MTRTITPSAARLVTALRYRDLAAAIEWLCIAFGFEKHRVISGEDGAVAVAQLLVGGNMIMLLPVGGSELDRLMRQPDEIGGAETQSCYLAVDDIDAHYAIAKAAGAEFVLDLKAYDNGGRGFSCRDPEGHIWNFGTYDPWEGKSLFAPPPPADKPAAPRGKRHAAGLMVAMAVVTVVVGMGGWTLATLQHGAPAAKEMRFSATEETRLSAVEDTRLKAEIAAAQKRTQEALDRVARITAELAQERSARQSAEHAAQAAREAVQAPTGRHGRCRWRDPQMGGAAARGAPRQGDRGAGGQGLGRSDCERAICQADGAEGNLGRAEAVGARARGQAARRAVRQGGSRRIGPGAGRQGSRRARREGSPGEAQAGPGRGETWRSGSQSGPLVEKAVEGSRHTGRLSPVAAAARGISADNYLLSRSRIQ